MSLWVRSQEIEVESWDGFLGGLPLTESLWENAGVGHEEWNDFGQRTASVKISGGSLPSYYKRFNTGKGEIQPCVGCDQLPFWVTLLILTRTTFSLEKWETEERVKKRLVTDKALVIKKNAGFASSSLAAFVSEIQLSFRYFLPDLIKW